MQKLKSVSGRVIISIDLEGKNSHTFQDGTVIRLERKYNNFNRRYTEPVNAIVVDAENIPEGAEVLIHHNATHDVNKIFNHGQLSGNETGSSIKYYSVSEEECYAWRLGDNEWQPTIGFDFALRIFKPYMGVLCGIEPTDINQRLFMLTGEYKDKAVVTLKGCDYEIIFQNEKGREEKIIRCRPNGDKRTQREEEVIAIDEGMTDKVLNGKLIVGIDKISAKQLYDEKQSVCV